MNSNNPAFKWKPVKKGRSSRKSSGRCLNRVSKFDDFDSPKVIEDFSGSDSDKFTERPLGQSISSMLESVPIKKRRHFLCNPSFESNAQVSYPRCHSDDFSGIELLATAAGMSDDSDNCDKEILVEEDSSLKLGTSDSSCGALPPETCLKFHEPAYFSDDMTKKGGIIGCSDVANESSCDSQSLSKSTQSGILSRKNWDLNILMDSWDEPYDSLASLKELDDTNIEKVAVECSDYINALAGTSSERPNLNLDENNSAISSPDEPCMNFSGMEAKPGLYCTTSTSDGIINGTEDEIHGMTGSQNLGCDEVGHQTINADNMHVCFISSEPSCKSSTSVCEGKIKSENVSINGVCSINLCDWERIEVPEKLHLTTRIGSLTSMAEHADLQCRDSKDSCNFAQDNQALLIANSNSFVNARTGSQAHAVLENFFPAHEDKNYSCEESNITKTDVLNKSNISVTLLGPPKFDGMLNSTNFTQQDSDISKAHHFPVVHGGSLTVTKEEHDSVYEDGELRGSYMYSWEENECVDYDSDGRNGEDEYVDDCLMSEFTEGGSEISHGIRGRSLVPKAYHDTNDSKSEHDENTPTKNYVVGDRDNDDTVGKGSNAGSGATVELSIENIEENGDSRNRKLLTDRSGSGVKIRVTNQYASNLSRREFQYRNNGSIFTQSCRSHRHGSSYSHMERDIYVDKYVNRRSRIQGGSQWTSWSSRMRKDSDYHLSEYHGPIKPRNIRNDSSERIDTRQDFVDSRQTGKYLPKGLQRPILRHPFIEREEYGGVRNRTSLARGRGHYSHRAEDLSYLHNESRSFPRFPQSSSRRERSLSPNSIESSQMHLPRRSSRSKSKSHPATMWNPHRDRRQIGSPREARSERTGMPFYKQSFGANYDEENYRFVDDSQRHSKRRRSPTFRAYRHPQRFDPDDSPGQLEANHYYRPEFRHTRSFPFDPSGKVRKSESDYNDRKQDGCVRMIR